MEALQAELAKIRCATFSQLFAARSRCVNHAAVEARNEIASGHWTSFQIHTLRCKQTSQLFSSGHARNCWGSGC